MKLSILRRWVWLVLVAPLASGCVSYDAYRKVQEELERAKTANRDLLAEYRKAIQQLGRGGEETTVTLQGVPQAEYDNVRAQLANLERELDRQRKLALEFTQEDADRVSNAQLEDGGLALGSELLFNAGVSQLKSAQLPELDQLAQLLKARYPGQRFVVEGHTDNQPLKSVKNLYHYNINLGYQRAYSVFEYLHKKHDLPEESFRILTFGFTKPVNPADPDSEDGRRQNRRVVIRLAGEQF